MSIAEVPVLCQNLPLPAAELLGGQVPQDRAEVLCLWLVVLLEAQRPPHPGILLIAHVILKPKAGTVFHIGIHICIQYMWYPCGTKHLRLHRIVNNS